ncbi:MAG: PLP-dependent aminotransferase family protein [Lachnospiraceae bacterium]|nr:PLP-dependent aminotransferase family protein [Lachnospiraceae bacterium]MCM1240017.1 PLP-dependent aminotransferase family protein [Lachnospiraceae bacterium]
MYDMTIELRTDSDKCLYEQIYDHIKTEIKDGKLLAGERLPSTRSLAEYLQVARSTVEYAYEQLLSEGYIESRPYRGYFVCAMEELFRMEDSGKELLGERERAGNAQEETAWEYNFSPHEIDMSGFPFGVWKKITKNILTDGNSELFARGEAQGDHDLRETISRYLHSSRGVNCRPEQIIVGAGNDYLLMLLEKILGRHVCIAMENPTYIRTYRIFRSFAYDIVTVDMDESGMRTDCLVRENVRAAYVMPSHQFPMGTVMPIGRRTELLKWAAGASDRYLIEDDYDSEFRYHGKPIPALLASDRQGKVIYIGTFSKAIAPAIRVSFMVLPQSLLERYWRECSFYSCTVSRIDQRILNEFIRDGYFERHLNKMRKIYRAKQELLLRCLEPFKRDYTISGENTGLHLILTAKGDVSEEELLERAGRERVKVYGLSENMVEDSDRRATVLIGFGGLTQEQIAGGVERLRKAWL